MKQATALSNFLEGTVFSVLFNSTIDSVKNLGGPNICCYVEHYKYSDHLIVLFLTYGETKSQGFMAQ